MISAQRLRLCPAVRLRGLALAGALAGASACTGTDVGNPVIVDVSFASYNRSLASAEVDIAAIAVDRIRLRPASPGCSGSDAIEVEGPFPLDLVSGAMPEALRGLELADQAYCRIEIEWHSGAALGEPPGEDAIVVAGVVDGRRFTIASRRNDELRLDAISPEGFNLDRVQAGLFVAFDMAAWLAGVELSDAEPQGDGSVLVDDDNNSDLLELFEANVEDAARVFLDANGDGILAPDEHEEEDALAVGVR
jgi:hypothetical protein